MPKLKCDQNAILATQFYGPLRAALAAELAARQASAEAGSTNTDLAMRMNELSTMLQYDENGFRTDMENWCFGLDAWLENVDNPNPAHRRPYPEMPGRLETYMRNHPEFVLPFEVQPNPNSPSVMAAKASAPPKKA